MKPKTNRSPRNATVAYRTAMALDRSLREAKSLDEVVTGETRRAQLRTEVLLHPDNTPFICLSGFWHNGAHRGSVHFLHPTGSTALQNKDLQEHALAMNYQFQTELVEGRLLASRSRFSIWHYAGDDESTVRRIDTKESRLVMGAYLDALREAWLAQQPEEVRAANARAELAKSTLPPGSGYRSARPGDVLRLPHDFKGNEVCAARLPSRSEAEGFVAGLPLEAREIYNPEVYGVLDTGGKTKEYVVMLADVGQAVADCLRDGAEPPRLEKAVQADFRRVHGQNISGRLETREQVLSTMVGMADLENPGKVPIFKNAEDKDFLLTGEPNVPFLCFADREGLAVHFLPETSFHAMSSPQENLRQAIRAESDRLDAALGQAKATPVGEEPVKVFHFTGERMVPVTANRATQIAETFWEKQGETLHANYLPAREDKPEEAVQATL